MKISFGIGGCNNDCPNHRCAGGPPARGLIICATGGALLVCEIYRGGYRCR